MDFVALLLTFAFKMATFAAIDAPSQRLSAGICLPNFKTSFLCVTVLETFGAFGNTCSATVSCFVASFVALEAEFFKALEGVVATLAAEDAV